MAAGAPMGTLSHLLLLLLVVFHGLVRVASLAAVPESCTDEVDWQDINGYTCDNYRQYAWCESGWYGKAWNSSWGAFSSFRDFSGSRSGADVSCCGCGRVQYLKTVDCAVGEWANWANCTLVGDELCQRTRLRPVLAMPRYGTACPNLSQTEDCQVSQCLSCDVTHWSDWQCYSYNQEVRTRHVVVPSTTTRCPAQGQVQNSTNCSAHPALGPGYLLQPMGNNAYGQLGLEGVSFQSNLSTLVSPPFGLPITSVVCGSTFSAVLAGGLLFMTGDNNNGQLGLGDLVQRTVFQMLPSPDDTHVILASLGVQHSAVLTARGAVYTFGNNDAGQLGRGNYTMSLVPVELLASGGGYFIDTGINVTKLALGGLVTVLLTDNGAVYIFGWNEYGQLGLNSTIGAFPYPMLVTGLQGVAIQSVAVGVYHTIFLSSSSTAYATGSNSRLQLGLPATISRVFAPTVLPNLRVAQVATMNLHTLFLATNNTLFVCGDNSYGQLGVGRFVYTVALQPVGTPADSKIVGIAAGVINSAVYDMDGDVYISGGYNMLGWVLSCPWTATATSRCNVFSLVTNAQYQGNVAAMSSGAYSLMVLKAVTGTPTPTPAATLTATPTATLTDTQPPTPTVSFPFCGPQSLVNLAEGPWILASRFRCIQVIALGPGSNTWQDRSVALHLRTLDNDLAVHITAGCDSGCEALYTSADSGTEQVLPLNGTDAGSLSVFYSGSIRTSKSRVTQVGGVDVKFFLVHKASSVLLALLCTVAAVCAACLVALGWCVLRCWHRRSRARTWSRNPRTMERWQKWLAALAAWAMLTGVAWAVAVALTSAPDLRPVPLFGVGVGLVALSAATLAAYGVWAMRDPTQHHCVSCEQPVSRWRFWGTYLPDPDNTARCFKAHTGHIQCVVCRSAVITHAWLGATKQRPYHLRCWEQFSGVMVADPAALSQWIADHPPDGPPETELAHVLAFAVKASAVQCVTELLRLCPSLASAAISDESSRSALHLAARGGNLSILELLMQANPYCLDPAFHMPSERRPSISLQQFGEDSDIYLHLPFLTLNDRPVYCGHARGRYLYWYDPDTDDGEEKYTPGWCVAALLGSGLSPWRLPLPDPLAEEGSDPASPRRPHHHNHPLARLFHHHHRKWKKRPLSPANRLEAGPPKRLWRRKNKKKQPPDEGTDGMELKEKEGSLLEPTAVVHPDVKVDFLFHGVSLMEEAVLSGDEPTIRYVAQIYRTRHPECLRWQHHTGHGLWDDYPASSQAAICTALQLRETLVAVSPTPATSATLDLQRRMHTSRREVAAVRCRMGPLFQRREMAGGPHYEVIWQPPAPLQGYESVVTLSPHHTLVAAGDALTLGVLWDEGVIDLTMLAPPHKVNGTEPQLATSTALDHSEELLKGEVSVAIGMDGRALPALQRFDCSRRAAGRAKTTVAPTATHGGGPPSTGIGNRLQDGLEDQQSSDTLTLYSQGYENKKGTLPFCAALPKNPLRLKFELSPIVQMALDALMKVGELQRQRFPLAARHVVAVYVYSYELPGEGDQIYGEMNKAMRLRDEPKLDFWRPLIWDVDMALRALPPYEGKSYRGIKCQVSPREFEVGATICWTAFSSASQRKAVAEEFAKPKEGRGAGAVGTLFFVTGFGAKPISAVSRYPEEAEVLFPPNTLFQVTSTLFGNSEIGEFYNVVDNVAMTQVSSGQGRPRNQFAARLHRLPHHHPFLLHVPTALTDTLLDTLLAAGVKLRLLSPPSPTAADGEDGPFGELQLLQCPAPPPDPIVTSYGSYQPETPQPSSYQHPQSVPSILQSSYSDSTPVSGRPFQWPAKQSKPWWRPSSHPLSDPSLSSSNDSSFGASFPADFPNNSNGRGRTHHRRTNGREKKPDSYDKLRLVQSPPHPDSGPTVSFFHSAPVFHPPVFPLPSDPPYYAPPHVHFSLEPL